MKRSVFLSLAVSALLSTTVAHAARVSRGLTTDKKGENVLVLKIAASNRAIYGVDIRDASGSVADIIAPKGWVGVAGNDRILFRTGARPIRTGATFTFRVYTADPSAKLTVRFRGPKAPFGSTRSI